MKNNSPVEPVQAARATSASRVTEIQSTEQFQTTNADRLKLREETANLTDRAVLAEIGELQTLAQLFPRRMAHLGSCLEADLKAEIQTTSEFISGKLNPRVRQLEQRALTQARAALKPHFPNPDELERHVSQSALVLELRFAAPSITDNPAGGAERYTQTALAAWAKLDEIEAKL